MAAYPLLVARLSLGLSHRLLVDSSHLLSVGAKPINFYLLPSMARPPHLVTKLHLLEVNLYLVFQKKKKKKRERLRKKD